MNYDEFAFFNEQLAAMLREGIPLEGALKQLCAGMRGGRLRAEIQQLESDLSRGMALEEALGRRSLPEFYRRMVQIGARSDDLPTMLTLLADHYHKSNVLWTRLQGLMVYPLLVIVVSLGLTLAVAVAFNHFFAKFFSFIQTRPEVPLTLVWMAPVMFGLAVAIAAAAISLPRLRNRLRWRLPAFREASLAQVASVLSLVLRKGVPLSDALAMAEALEAGTPAASVLAEWRKLAEAGQGKPAQWSAKAPFPPLFLWLVQNSGEEVAAGFERASEIYRGRASYRTELALYGALPISVLLLGQMVLWQAAPLMRSMIWMMNVLGRVD